MSGSELDSTNEHKEEMLGYVKGLPDDKRRLFCTWAIAQRISHVGTDYFGNRLSPEERKVWKHVAEAVEKEMKERYSLESRERLGDFFEAHHMHDMGYRKVFIDVFIEEYNK